MKKTQIKLFGVALSIAMVAFLAPAMASATTEARKIDNKTAYKTAFNYDESITFEEAFPSEWFRDSIKEVLKSERERSQYGDAKGEYDSTKIELEDDTLLDSEIKEQLSMVKSLSLTMNSDTHESEITMKDLESIGKYFTGLEELSLSSITIHGGYDELSEALSTFSELKVKDLAGCVIDDDYNQAAITNVLIPNETEVETDKVGATREIEYQLGYDADEGRSGILLYNKSPYEAVDSSYRESYDSNNGSWRYDKTSGRWCFIVNNQGELRDCVCKINGRVYVFDKDGWMSTGWKEISDHWYYLNKKGEGTEGAATTNSWRKINGDWYYFYEDGKMASNTVIGSYYVNKKGVMFEEKWVKSGSKYWYSLANGLYAENEFKEINNNTYSFDFNGWMETGWINDRGNWYYFNKKGEGTEGAMVHSGWKIISGKWYYFYDDGHMASDTTIGSYYVNSSGVWVKGQWVKSGSRYWYKQNDGKYPKNCFRTINNNTYYFDNNGWMKTGWINKYELWFYCNKKGEGTEGAMAHSGWKKINGKWYYFGIFGEMFADTMVDSCWLDSSGAWVKSQWVKSGSRYWYRRDDGKYLKDCFEKINNNLYYFDNNGWMKTGWLNKYGGWHYFNKKGEGTEGAMVRNSWKKINGKWYYFYELGNMATNTTIGSSYISSSGAWVKGQWVKSGSRYWYKQNDGKYPKNCFTKINNNTYYFDNNGWMKTGWLKEDGEWYYFNKKGEGTEGAMAHSGWKKINGKWYYFGDFGTMASDCGIDNYYFNENGTIFTGGWIEIDEHRYYYDKDGVMVSNKWKEIDGSFYYFDEDGTMTVEIYPESGEIVYSLRWTQM